MIPSSTTVGSPRIPVAAITLASQTTPHIFSLSPNFAIVGSPAFTLTIKGNNYSSSSVVLWNGSALPTTFLSKTVLQASVPGTVLHRPGKASLTVVDPAGTSNAFPFILSLPVAPTLSRVTPGSASAGGRDVTLVVQGFNFRIDSVVLWNGSPLATTFVDGHHLQANVPGRLLARTGKNFVQVRNLNGIVPAGQFDNQLESNRLVFVVNARSAQVRAALARYERVGSGTLAAIAGTFTAGSATAHRVRIAWGDGTATVLNLGSRTSGSFRASHTYRRVPVSRTVTIVALDGSGTSSAPVTVRLAPLHAPRHR